MGSSLFKRSEGSCLPHLQPRRTQAEEQGTFKLLVDGSTQAARKTPVHRPGPQHVRRLSRCAFVGEELSSHQDRRYLTCHSPRLVLVYGPSLSSGKRLSVWSESKASQSSGLWECLQQRHPPAGKLPKLLEAGQSRRRSERQEATATPELKPTTREESVRLRTGDEGGGKATPTPKGGKGKGKGKKGKGRGKANSRARGSKQHVQRIDEVEASELPELLCAQAKGQPGVCFWFQSNQCN